MSEVEAVDGPDQLRLLVIEHAKLWALLVALPPKFALSLLRALVEVAPPSQMGGAGTKWSLTCRKPRGMSSPISWVWSPRACSLTERISDSSRTEIVLGARGASLPSSCLRCCFAVAHASRSPPFAPVRS